MVINAVFKFPNPQRRQQQAFGALEYSLCVPQSLDLASLSQYGRESERFRHAFRIFLMVEFPWFANHSFHSLAPSSVTPSATRPSGEWMAI